MLDDRRAVWVAAAAVAGGAVGTWAFCRWLRSAPAAANAPAGTAFESYLKRPISNPSLASKPSPYSFEAYLRSPAPSQSPATPPTPAASNDASPAAPPDARPVLVLFGTEFGFSKEVAQRVCHALHAGGQFWPQLVDMADHPAGLPQLPACQALLVVCSTQGDGVPPGEARAFCDWLGSAAAPALPGVHFSVAALGDKAYTHFARCGKTLDARLEQLGAARFAPRVDVHKEDFSAIDAWIEGVVAGLQALPLQSVARLGAGAGAVLAPPSADGAVAKRWSKQRPYYGTVVAVEGLCTVQNDHDKNTVRVEIDLGDSGLTYAPGDALGVWPSNPPATVTQLLQAMQADGATPTPTPSWHYQDHTITSHTGSTSSSSTATAINGSTTVTGTNTNAAAQAAAAPAAAAAQTASAPGTPSAPWQNAGFTQSSTGLQPVASPSLQPTPNGLARSGGGRGESTLEEVLSRCYDLRSPRPELLPMLLAKLHALVAEGNGHAAPAAQPTRHAPADGHTNGADAPICSSQENDALVSVTVASTKAPRHTFTLLANAALPATPAMPPQLAPAGTTNGSQTASLHTLSGLEEKVQRLEALVADADAAERYLAERHVADVLADWAPSRVSPEELLCTLRPLAPRLYSISSSPLEAPARVQVSVAVVRYEALNRHRLGVCSTHLGERTRPGELIPVYVSPNPDFRLPPNPSTPIVMVGPGTGLAPFRAFLLQRILECQEAAPGPAALFFGCRRRDQDFLYGSLLEEWAAKGWVRLFTAFSRAQGQKVYVQHRLREQGDLVFSLLQAGGHFYVCGDAKSMAPAVEQALLELLAARLPGGVGAAGADMDGSGMPGARAYLEALARSGRYQRDVWQ